MILNGREIQNEEIVLRWNDVKQNRGLMTEKNVNTGAGGMGGRLVEMP